MNPVAFEGSQEIGKPKSMTDEQCFSIAAMHGIDGNGFPYFLTAWKPSYEDLQALNRGEPVYVKTISTGLPPMCLFTVDENGICNDAE
jgi:hypothetical protein